MAEQIHSHTRPAVLLPPEEIEKQREYLAKCAEALAEHFGEDHTLLALVRSYGCQQNTSDGERIMGMLAEMGFEMVEVTKLSGDGGIDVRDTLVVGDVVRIKMAVQVKKWKLKNNILAPVVQPVRGSLGAHEQGLIITTSDFSAGAIKEAAQPDKTPIALMNGEQLVMLLMEHGIGVHRSTPDLFEIDEEFAVITLNAVKE